MDDKLIEGGRELTLTFPNILALDKIFHECKVRNIHIFLPMPNI